MTEPFMQSGQTVARPAGSQPVRAQRSLLAVLAVLLGALGAANTARAEVKLQINGLPEALEENVRIYVGTLPNDTERAVRRYKRDLAERSLVALSALGYYAADVEVDSRVEGKNTIVVIDAKPNDPVRVKTINLQITGPAREDSDFMSVIRRMPLQKNEVFLSGDYEGTKGLLRDQAQDLGYFDFTFPVSNVRVSREQLAATINLTGDSGPRYTFGNIQFDQDAFTEQFLMRWLTFEPGDPYSTEAVADLTGNLRDSGYFTSVRVVPQRDDRYGTSVPVRITLVKKQDNLVGIGIGYATDVGPRFSLSWEKPLINRRGHSATSELEISQPRQSLALGYRIPRTDQPLTNYYGFDFGVLHEKYDESDTETLKSTLSFQRVSKTTHDFTQSLFVRWEHEKSTISDVEDETDLVLPGVSYQRTRIKGRPFTTWGQSENISIYGGSKALLSTIDLFKITGEFRYLRGFFERSTFIGAVQLGWLESNDFDRVPASQRFFAGGDRSVRGFKYRAIAPEDAEGDPIGGRYLEVFSAEYNYRVYDAWSGAVFVDAGRAFDSYDTAYSTGAGVGIRWQSPVGPFRIDIARPISDGDGNDVRLHLSLGSEL